MIEEVFLDVRVLESLRNFKAETSKVVVGAS